MALEDKCPYCDSKNIIFEDGEWTCRDCGEKFSSDEIWER